MPNEILILPVVGDARLREQRFRQDRVTIGRQAENDLPLPGEAGGTLSRRHAELFLGDDGVLYVKDLGSRAGTWVNGIKIRASTPVRAKDVVALGENGPSFRVRLEGEDDAPPPSRSLSPSPDRLGSSRAGKLHQPSSQARSDPPEPPTVSSARTGRVPEVPPALAPTAVVKPYVEPPLRQSQFVNLISEVVARERSKALYLAMVLVVAWLGGTVLYLAWSRGDRAHVDDELHRLGEKVAQVEDQNERLRSEIAVRDRKLEELSERAGLSDTERATLAAEIKTDNAKLRAELKKNEALLISANNAAGDRPTWPDIVERYRGSVFLCVHVDRAKGLRGFGTAFAISADGLLATNAHVVEGLKEAPQKYVIQNETGRVFQIKDLVSSPNYKGVKSPDVGLIRLDVRDVRFVPLPLGTDDDLRRMKIGSQLGTLGFPGELAASYFSSYDKASKTYKGVIATFKEGLIGRITDYEDKTADFDRSTYIQHSASLTGGTSGSPMFTSDGKVVALNNASWDQQVVTESPGRNGQKKTETVRSKSAAEISFAIRVDELRHLWEEMRW